LGHCLFCLGHWQEAEERLERAVEMGHSRGSSWFSASALLYLGNLLLARGEWKQAADYLQEAIALAERSQDLTVLPTAQGLLAELRLAQGWPPPLDRLEHLAGQTGLGITTLLPYLARVYLEMHDVGRAEATVERGVQTATVQHQHLALLEGFRVQGMVRSRQGRWEEAERSFQDAVALARSMPHPYAEARTLYERGIMEAQRRKPEEARRLLEEALAIFQRLGAQPYIQRTEQALVDYVSG
jgi:tetratricopeptide (TPR) repeat protein